MNELKDYKNRTSLNFRKVGPYFKNVLPCGIDIGYGAVKVYSENGQHILPSMARLMERDIVSFPNPTNIKYKNANGNLWYIGRMVQEVTGLDDPNIDVSSILAMDRINNAEYKALFDVAMGLAMLRENDNGDIAQYTADNRKLMVTTGLPSKFKTTQGNMMYDNLVGRHEFTLQIGENEPVAFSFTLSEEQLNIVSQPFGTLFGYAVDENGKGNLDIAQKRVLILDIGFYTADAILCSDGLEKVDTTWPDSGMAAVYKLVAKDLNGRGAPVTQLTLDKYFDSGKVPYSNNGKRDFIELEPIFREYENEVIARLMANINGRFNSLADVDYMLVSGGTGGAWFDRIKQFADEYWSGVSIDLAQGSESSLANVIGYHRCQMFNLNSQNELPANNNAVHVAG